MKTFDKKDIFTCVTADEAIAYIGNNGYFANSLSGFNHIDCFAPYSLDEVQIGTDKPFVYKKESYALFLPADKVKKVEEPKKYRPFTLEEFLNKFSVGTKISMREKDQTRSFYCLFEGYQTVNDQTEKSHILVICSLWYSLNELLNKYEYLDEHGKWQPFGVEE